MDDPALALLAALAADDGASLARLRKRCGLPMSSVLRAANELVALDLVARVEQDGRDCLRLTEKGWSVCHPT